MAQQLSEASGNVEVLEASEEGKKKSKFKAFKSFFGKKKKKEPEDAQGESRIQISLSSGNVTVSSLNPVPAGQLPEIRPKSHMGMKAVSHDSIFMLEPGRERSASKMSSSPELERGRTLQVIVGSSYQCLTGLYSSSTPYSYPSKRRREELGPASQLLVLLRAVAYVYIYNLLTYYAQPLRCRRPNPQIVFRLPQRILPRSVLSDVSGALHQYVPRSGIWVAGSKITEILPLRPRQPSISPPLIRTDTISMDFEEISVDDGLPIRSQKKSSSHKTLTVGKSSSEISSGLIRLPSLTTLASSSSTQLSIGFSTPATTQGCLDSSAARHKMALNPRKQRIKKELQVTVKPKQEEPSLPLASEEEKSTTEIKEPDQKKPKKDSAGTSSQEQSNETEIYAKNATDQKKASNTDAAESQGYPVSAAHGGKGSSTSGTSECGSKGRRLKKSSQAHGLGDRAESPSAEKTAKDCPLRYLPLEKQVMEQPTTPESETATPQELLNASIDGKARKASAPQRIPEDGRESMVSGPPPNNEDRASGAEKTEAEASLSPAVESPSTTQEDGTPSVRVEAQALMDPSQIQSEGEASPSLDSQNAQCKMESAQDTPTICKEKHPANMLQAFTASTAGTASARAERSISAERLPPRSLSQALERPEDCQQVSDSESTSEEESDSEDQLAPGHSFQTLGKLENEQEVSSESESLVVGLSSSGQQMALRPLSQALGEPENEEVSRGSNSYVEKYNSAKDWSSSEGDPHPRHPSQALGKPEDQQEVSSVPENTPEEWSVSAEKLPPKCPSQPFMRPTGEQQDPSGSMSTSTEWSGSVEPIISMELLPPRRTIQPWMSPKVEQQVSSFPESTVVEGSISTKQLPPKLFSQSLMNVKVEQKVFSVSEGVAAERIMSVQPPLPRYSSQSLKNPEVQQIFSGSTAVEEGSFEALLPPGSPLQPWMKPKFQPQIVTLDSKSASAEWKGSVEPLLPRHPFQSWMRPQFKQQVSAGSKSAAFQGSMSMELLPCRHHYETLMKPIVEQEVSSVSMSASVERSSSVKSMSPRRPFQPRANPKSEQQVSTGPESTAVEGGISEEELPSRHPSRSIVRHRVQEITSSFESAAIEGGISGKPLPPKYPIQLLTKSKVQEMSSRLENADAEKGISKKSPLPRHPPQSFVKFMAQHIFSGSESPAVEGSITVDPLPPDHSSKSLSSPKVKHQVFSASESANIEEGIAVKPMATKHPLQSLEKPEDQQEVSSGSENTPEKWSSSKKQQFPKHLSQALEKPEHQQEMSVSKSFPEEGRSSKEQLPSRCPFQATDSKPQISSTGSVSVPVGCSSPEKQLPSRQSFQASKDPVKGTSFESDPGSGSLPKAQVSPDRSKRRIQGSEDLTKSLATKPVKVTTASALKTSISVGLHSKKEVLESGDQNDNKLSSSPASGADVKSIFGVRLRKTPSSQKYKSEKQGDFTKRPISLLGPTSSTKGREQVRKTTSQGRLGTSENLTRTSDLAKKQQMEPKSEGVTKKQPAYKIPGETLAYLKASRYQVEQRTGNQNLACLAAILTPFIPFSEKAPGRQPDDATSEPAWITMVKQRQKTSQAQVPVKELNTKKGDGAKAKTKEPRYGGANPANEDQQKISVSSVYRQEKMAQAKLPKSTKAGKTSGSLPPPKKSWQVVVKLAILSSVQGQKMVQVPAKEKETRRSAALPAALPAPVEQVEPVWFSLAKKKAKAWSHIAEIMQ
ncbi:acrosomal protein KIAA1210 homolog [Loxodonta africana]|uniref:acrosomal protein KIAA1210 homolog n=1 Tax=Loxodonta africana TaxID=9785 RepID=UPI0030CE611A